MFYKFCSVITLYFDFDTIRVLLKKKNVSFIYLCVENDYLFMCSKLLSIYLWQNISYYRVMTNKLKSI